MTKITGKPNWSGPLKMVIRENIPYRTAELGVSPGYYEGTWNGSDWGINAIMPRYDQPDAIPLAGVSIFISRTDTGAVVAKYDYTPQEWIETSPGIFDLGKAYGPRTFVRTQQIVDAALDATAAARSVTSATTDLSKEKASLDGFMNGQKTKVDTAIGAQKSRVDSAITALGGIRQITVTPTYVELADVSGTRLEESTHTTPNGVTLDTITIIPEIGGN